MSAPNPQPSCGHPPSLYLARSGEHVPIRIPGKVWCADCCAWVLNAAEASR